MYTMKADGQVFYSPEMDDAAYKVLSPKLKYALNKAGSLTFLIQPGNVMYGEMHKLKTIITVEQDGEEIFRGRVLETETDMYNQMEVYCEGALSFLLDSLQRPCEFEGSAAEYFAMLIANHNEQVEEGKQFVVGVVTAVNEEDTVEIDNKDYVDTLSEIKSVFVSEFGGYIRARYENGVHYLDYIDAYNDECSQPIKFGVNLVDIENKIDAQNVCTVLIPLGKAKSGKALTIADVNNGVDYIEDAEGIARHGRIVKKYTWDDVDDPQELLELGQEHITKMKEEASLTLKAVDMHVCDVSIDRIRLGSTVQIDSNPHGLNKTDICTEIELEIEDPEQSTYTFGLPKETLTESTAKAAKKNSQDMWHVHRWLTETENSFEVFVDAVDSKISLKADLILLDGYVKATDLEADVLTVIDSAIIPELSVINLGVSGPAILSGNTEITNLSIGGETAATQKWVNNQGFATRDYVQNSFVFNSTYLTKIASIESRLSALEG